MKPVRIAQIGVTHEHARGKIATLKNRPDLFEITAVVDDRGTAHTPFCSCAYELYDGLPHSTLDEVLNDPSVEAAVVEVPNNELVPVSLQIMEQGKHMHMDKPGGEDLALFRSLLDGCRKRNLVFQMGYMFRPNPMFRFALEAYRKGWLGEIFHVEADMNHNYGDAAYHEYIRSFRGGIMYNLGCHIINFIVELLGRPENVFSMVKASPGDPDDAKNNCAALLVYPHASAAITVCSREAMGSDSRRIAIRGTRGAIVMTPLEIYDGKTPMSLQLFLSEDNAEYKAGLHTVSFGPRSDRFDAQLEEFAKIIRGERPPCPEFELDDITQEVTLAASGMIPWK